MNLSRATAVYDKQKDPVRSLPRDGGKVGRAYPEVSDVRGFGGAADAAADVPGDDGADAVNVSGSFKRLDGMLTLVILGVGV